MWFYSIFDDFISLIYPKICIGCNQSLLKHEECICTICKFHIPKTNHFIIKENNLKKLFWGKVEISRAAALYEFIKDLNDMVKEVTDTELVIKDMEKVTLIDE